MVPFTLVPRVAPHRLVAKAYGPSLTMGTLGKPAKSDRDKTRLSFDATPKDYPTFKQAVIKLADAEGCPWAVTGGNAICGIFQAANAKLALKATKKAGAKISLDIATYTEVSDAFELSLIHI